MISISKVILLPLKVIIYESPSSRMSRCGIMATQLLAGLTTVHHPFKRGIVVYLVNPRHLFQSIPLDVCFVSRLEWCCYASFRELILSCSIFEKINPSRVSFSSRCHVGWSSQSKMTRQRWWSNQHSSEVQPGSWRLRLLHSPFILPYAWISGRDSCLVLVSCHIPSFWHCTRLASWVSSCLSFKWTWNGGW